MRILETLLVLVILVNLFLEFRKKNKLFLIAFSVVLLVSHIVLEGVRWQLFFVYLVTLFLFVIAIFRLFKIKLQIINRAVFIILMTFSLLSTSLGILFPIFKLPEPSGLYNVGITYQSCENPDRNIFFHQNGNKHIGMTIWYPIDDISSQAPEKYYVNSNLVSKWIGKVLYVPGFIFSHLNLVYTNSYKDRGISKKETSYPVIIFSHGFCGLANQNSVLMEELASHGYIVIAVSHTYEAAITFLTDNEYIPYDETLVKLFNSTFMDIYPIFQKRVDSSDPVIRKELARQMVEKSTLYNDLIDLRVEDINFIIKKIKDNELAINFLNNALDTKNIGLIGHSMGGATAYYSMIQNESIRSGINIDGSQFGSYRVYESAKPFLYITTDTSSDFNDFIYNNHHYTKIIFSGAKHYDFTDLTLFSKLFQVTGHTSQTNIHEFMNRYILSFFNQTLKSSALFISRPLNNNIIIEEIGF